MSRESSCYGHHRHDDQRADREKKSVKERKKTSGTRCVKLDIYGEEKREKKVILARIETDEIKRTPKEVKMYEKLARIPSFS